MPPPLEASDILDLTNSEIGEYAKQRAANTQGRVEHVGIADFWERATSRKVPHDKVNWDVRLRKQPTTRQLQYFDVVNPEIVYVLEKAQMGRHDSIQSVMYDVKENEFADNDEVIVDHVDSRLDAATEDVNDYWDVLPFRAPNDAGATDEVWGLPVMFPMLGVGVQDDDGGFNGQTRVYLDGSTGTTYGTIDSALVANTRWRPWVATCGEVADETFIRKWKKAIRRTGFKALKRYKVSNLVNPRVGSTIYVNRQDWDDLTDKRNAAAFADGATELAPTGDVKISGANVQDTEALDDQNGSPSYLVVWKHHAVRTAASRWFKYTKAVTPTNQPDVAISYIKCSGLMYCTNLREGGACIHRVRAS